MEKLLPKKGIYIIMVKSYGALAKVIRFGMRVEQLFKREKYVDLNHADILIDGMVSGAIKGGVANRTVNNSYLTDGKKRELYVFKVAVPRGKKVVLRDFCLDSDNKKYEVLNFLWHAIDILFHKWKGKTGKAARKKVYCIEYAAMGINKLYPELIEKVWSINPNDLYKLLVADERFQLTEVIKVPTVK